MLKKYQRNELLEERKQAKGFFVAFVHANCPRYKYCKSKIMAIKNAMFFNEASSAEE